MTDCSAYQPQPGQLYASPPTSPKGPQMPDHATEAAELLANDRADVSPDREYDQ